MLLKFLIFLITAINCAEFQVAAVSIQQFDIWKEINSLISFQQTIDKFPYLTENVKPFKLAELIEKGGCKCEVQPVRFAIVDSQVYSYGKMKNHQRVVTYQRYLKSIVKSTKLPDLYFVLDFEDELIPEKVPKDNHENCQQTPLFIFNKNGSSLFEKSKFLLPDPFVVDRWEQDIQEVKEASKKHSWEDKQSKMFFRGIPSAPHFYDMKIDKDTDIFRYFHRGAYVLLSFEHPDLIDANFTKYPGLLSDEIQRRVGKDKVIFTKEVSLAEHMKYKYILSADGTGAPWKRIPFVFFSNSIIFRPYSNKIQWFYDKMLPETHFVSVKEDLSDLFARMEEMNNNPEWAKQIYRAANKLAEEYLTPEAISQFVVETLLKYAKYQQLNLDEQEKAEVKSGTDIQSVLKRKKQKEQQQLQDEKEKKKLSCITFEQTIEAYPFIKDNMDFWKTQQLNRQGNCNKNQLIQYLFIDNQVYVSGLLKSNNRTINITNMFKRLSQKQRLPDMYFIVDINDQLIPQNIQKQSHKICRQIPLFLMNKNCSNQLEQTKFLLPDPFVIHRWDEQIKRIKFQSQKVRWEDKLKKAFFRGLASSPNYYYVKQIDNTTNFKKYFHRASFVQLSNERPDIIDARFLPTSFNVVEPLIKQMKRRVGAANTISQRVDFSETYPKYRYILSADGFGAAWNRVPITFFSGSVLIKTQSEKIQWFYDKMIPDVHYVSLRQDLSDLIEKIEQMNKNDTKAREIVKEAAKMAEEFLSPQAIDKYTIETLNKYASIQKLQLDEDLKQRLKISKNFQSILNQQHKREKTKKNQNKDQQIKQKP